MISHLFPIDFSLLYLSISCPFLLSPENKSKKYWYVLLFFIFLHSKTEEKLSTALRPRIRAKYKDVVIQCCASGGGRANWGTSYFFPAIAMASHISAVPNHTVFRTTSLKYRIDVAKSSRLGMEIQPKNMTDEEKALCKKAISEYKEIRVCVLTYLNIDNTDISVLVKTSSKTISNARKKANRKLFGDDSASTLDENLLKF